MNGLVRYEIPVASGELALQGDWVWNDDRFFTVENQPGNRQDAYGLVNARVAYRFRDDQMEVAVFGKNLLDEDYLGAGFALTLFGGNVFQPGRPRMFGAELSYEF